MPKPPRRVREPVQVYLDAEDRAILLEIAERTALPQAEILRRGLRRLAADLTDNPPGGRAAAGRGGSTRPGDQRFSLTGAVTFALMRRERLKTAFAFDRNFRTAGFTLLGDVPF